MPQLAKKLLQRAFDQNLAGLYVALQKKGDSTLSNLLSAAGSGGLGRAFLTPQALAAFDIDAHHRLGKIVKLQLKDIKAMWDMVELFRVGKVQHFSPNPNKRIICLVFIIMQPVTQASIEYQERAYNALMDYYSADFNYKDQLLDPDTGNGITVYMHLETLKRQFLIDKAAVSPLQKSSTLSLVTSEYAPPGQNHVSHLSRESSGSGTGSGSGSGTRANYGYDPNVPALNPYGFAAAPRRASGSISVQPGEEKFEEEEPRAKRAKAFIDIEDFLQQMADSTTTHEGPNPFTIKQIKTAHMVFFVINIPYLTLLQLCALIDRMDNIQIHPVHNEKRFDPVRTETGWWRRLFFLPPLGNTETWQTMGKTIQATTLDKLVKNKRLIERPDLPPLATIPPEMLHSKLNLVEAEYNNYYKLFKISFGRNPNTTPEIFPRFTGQFTKQRNTDTASLLRRSKS